MLLTAGDQNPNTGIKTNMLKCSGSNRLRTVGYLSPLHKAQYNLPVLQRPLGNQAQDGGTRTDSWQGAVDLPLYPTGPQLCE